MHQSCRAVHGVTRCSASNSLPLGNNPSSSSRPLTERLTMTSCTSQQCGYHSSYFIPLRRHRAPTLCHHAVKRRIIYCTAAAEASLGGGDDGAGGNSGWGGGGGGAGGSGGGSSGGGGGVWRLPAIIMSTVALFSAAEARADEIAGAEGGSSCPAGGPANEEATGSCLAGALAEGSGGSSSNTKSSSGGASSEAKADAPRPKRIVLFVEPSPFTYTR